MSDSESPAEVRGGPIWRQGGPAAGAPGSPVAPSGPPTQFHGATDPTGAEDELYHPRYARNSGSAVPYMAAAFVLMAATWWAMRWSRLTADATDPVRSSEWWHNITAVLLPGEPARFASYSQTRMWVALVLLVLAAVSVIVWIGRIGSNLRSGQQPFGSFLPLVAFPAWWLLPVSLGFTADATRSRGDDLVRLLIAFGIFFAQFLLLRWPLLNRIWRAGALPYDLASILLWLPMMVPWTIWFLSSCYELLVTGEDGSMEEAAWRPTTSMLDWAHGLTRATSIATLGVLIVVTVVQHKGMAQDRAAIDASRQRAREQRLPLLPPGA